MKESYRKQLLMETAQLAGFGTHNPPNAAQTFANRLIKVDKVLDNVVDKLLDLLNTPDLNMDELDPLTRKAIKQAYKALEQFNKLNNN